MCDGVRPKLGEGRIIRFVFPILILIFWGWVLGTVGIFPAVPLTMALIIALGSSPQTQPIVILLGSEVTQKPEPEEETGATVGETD